VPYSGYLALWQALLRHSPGVPVGIEFGKFLSLDQLGYLGQVFRHARSGLDALRSLARFAALFDSHATRYPLELRVEERSVELRVARELTAVAPECVEAVTFALVTQLRNVGGQHVRLLAAHFHNQREPLRGEYERFLGCPVRFGCDEDALIFARAELEVPLSGANSEYSERIAAFVSRSFARAEDADAAFAAAVECAVRAQLQLGELSEARAAGALGMSLRSFQRKLRESGRSYSRIVADTRLANAQRLLADPRLAVYEVAFSLGYQDVSSFNRAFKRWTGKSPRAHRAQRG
jgi:AraC-like DNA-binding protein